MEGDISLSDHSYAQSLRIDDGNSPYLMFFHLDFAILDRVFWPTCHRVLRHDLSRQGTTISSRNRSDADITVSNDPDQRSVRAVRNDRNGANLVLSHSFCNVLDAVGRRAAERPFAHDIFHSHDVLLL
jgi:hypothetical protein